MGLVTVNGQGPPLNKLVPTLILRDPLVFTWVAAMHGQLCSQLIPHKVT